MFTLVATDLDGTLLRSDSTVSARTIGVLRRVVEAGTGHVIVTGRPPADCLNVFRALEYRGLAVCGQGAVVYDAGNSEVIAQSVLHRPTARRVVETLRRRLGGLSLAGYSAVPGRGFLATAPFAEDGGFTDCAPVAEAELWVDDLVKLFVRHPAVSEDALAAQLRAASRSALEVTHSGLGMVELLPLGVSKATGLAQVARRLGVPAERSVAFGDMPNDLPMLEWAGWGVAMGNAHVSLLAVADEIAPSHEADGVAVVLERLAERGLIGGGRG